MSLRNAKRCAPVSVAVLGAAAALVCAQGPVYAAGTTPTAAGDAGSIMAETGKCMVVRNADSTDNTPLITHKCGPEGQANQTWTFYSDKSLRGLAGKCVTVRGNAIAAGTAAVLSTCTGGNGQKWWPGPNGTLVNRWSGRCLEALNPDTNDGRLAIKDCDATVSGQRWSKNSWSAPPPQPIVGLASKCVDGGGRNSAFPERATLWECDGSDGQQWTVSSFDGRLKASGRCLDAKSGTDNNTPVELAACDSTSESQHWLLEPDGNVHNKAAERCLAVSGAESDDGTPLVIYDCGNGDEQRWDVFPPQ